MKIHDKCQFSDTADMTLWGVHGKASVLTVTGVAAGVVFLRQDWTGDEFMANESDVDFLAPDDAAFQTEMYRAHMERIRADKSNPFANGGLGFEEQL